MKVSMLGLTVSTVAFGASSIYLWNQLDREREQVAAVQAANAQLNARIVDLEKQRAKYAERRMGGPGGFEGAAMAHAGPGPEHGPPAEDQAGEGPGDLRHGFDRRPPEMPQAMQKMMRANFRAGMKRTYFDLQATLGLTDEQANAMFDLLADQQSFGMRSMGKLDPGEMRAAWEADQEKRKAEIADLLGPTKAAQFEDYQKSMPSRMELSTLAQQLEGAETPLSDDQKSRMLAALIEERDRIPAPNYSQGQSPEELSQAYNEWQTDYEKRVADQARGILSNDQLSTYNEYAQWQQQMREQFGAGTPPPRGMRNAGFAAVTMPIAAGGVVVSSSTTTVTPAEKTPQPK